MKINRTTLLISMNLLYSITLFSQNRVFMKAGNDYLINNKYDITGNGKYKLSKSGISIGILIPIDFKYLNAFYKAEITLHDIIYRDFRYQSRYNDYDLLFNKHISGVNEILLGKQIKLTESSIIVPQIGIGFQIESLYRDTPRNSYESITYNSVLFDIAFSYYYSFNQISIGSMINWSQGIKQSTFVYEATDRIGLSLLLGL